MKNLAVFIFMVMFLANTIVVSAWAKPCMMGSDIQMSQDMDTSMDADMPCHDKEQKNQNNPNKHCDGVCLCMHVSINQTPIINDIDALAFPAASKQNIVISQDNLKSRSTLPARRPPKFYS